MMQATDPAPKWRDLNERQQKLMGNGCGPKGRAVPVPQFFFEASCDHHDYNYWLGGDEDDRLKADQQFYQAMKRDAKRSSWWCRWWHQSWAWVYYQAVKRFGGQYFTYRKTPATSADLAKAIGEAIQHEKATREILRHS